MLKGMIQGYGSVYPPNDDAPGGLPVGTWKGTWTEQGALASHGDVQDNASLGCPRGELVDRPLCAVHIARCRVNCTTLVSPRTVTAIVLTEVSQVSMEAWTEDVGDDPPWEQKKDDRMLWRGKNTGIYFKDGVPWGECKCLFSSHHRSWRISRLKPEFCVSRSGTAFGSLVSFGVPHLLNYPPRAGHIPARADSSSDISQRVNLVERTALDEGYLPLLDVTPDNAPVGAPRQTLIDRLNTDLMDVAFVDEPIQCDPEICEIVKETYAYKGRKDWKAGNQ